MHLLITGASGYLGRRLIRRACQRHEVLALCRNPGSIAPARPLAVDLGDPTAIEHTSADPLLDWLDGVIHAAAINPGGDESRMHAVNVDGSRAVAEWARRAGARLVHVSTDVVHDGRRPPYGDDAPATPLHAYAASKAAAEEAVLEVLPSAVVVRTSLIYDLDEMDRGTAGFARRLEQGEPVRLFRDAIRHPIHVETLADALLQLLELDVSGRLNVAGRQILSREAFGRKMLEHWRVPEREQVESISAAELSDRIPLDLTLDLEKAESLGLDLPGVDEMLARAS